MADINPMIPMSIKTGTSPFIQAADIRRSLSQSDAMNLDTALKMEKEKKFNAAQDIIKKHHATGDPAWDINATNELYDVDPQMADMFVQNRAEHLKNSLEMKRQTEYNKLYPTAQAMLEQTVGYGQPAPSQVPQETQQAPGMVQQGATQQAPTSPAQAPSQVNPYVYQPQQQAPMGQIQPLSPLAQEQFATENAPISSFAGVNTPMQNLQGMLGANPVANVTPEVSLQQPISAGQEVPVAQTEIAAPATAPAANSSQLTQNLNSILKNGPQTQQDNSYIERYLKYILNPSREALATIEPALSSKDNASALWKANASLNAGDPNDPLRGLSPAQREKVSEWTEGQWQKFGKMTNPLSGQSRAALGIAGIANVRAGRAIATLDDPNVMKDPQVLNFVVEDLDWIFTGGVPSDQTQKVTGYNNVKTWWAGVKQKITGNPQEAYDMLANPQVIQQLKNVLGSVVEVDNQTIRKNFGAVQPLFQRIIDDDMRLTGGKRSQAFFEGLMGTEFYVPPSKPVKSDEKTPPKATTLPTLSPAEAAKLKKGTHFMGTDGKEHVRQ